MVRRVSPAQARTQIRQAQARAKQAVDRYNQQVRKVNRAIDDYNRAARTHNTQVRVNRQRLRAALQQMNARPRASTTKYVTYRTSVTRVERSFTAVDAAAAAGQMGAAPRVLDLVEAEAASSVETLNDLLDTPASAQALDLRMTVLVDELAEIAPELDARWRGALFALHPENPDAARHFCTSAREIISDILDAEAPDSAVKDAIPNYPKTPNGSVSRRAKILYFLERSGHAHDALTDFVETDIESVISLFTDFNRATHGAAGTFDLAQLAAIKRRVEGAIQFIHGLVR